MSGHAVSTCIRLWLTSFRWGTASLQELWKTNWNSVRLYNPQLHVGHWMQCGILVPSWALLWYCACRRRGALPMVVLMLIHLLWKREANNAIARVWCPAAILMLQSHIAIVSDRDRQTDRQTNRQADKQTDKQSTSYRANWLSQVTSSRRYSPSKVQLTWLSQQHVTLCCIRCSCSH